jgi:fumarate reductase flavoprotein subunit
MWVNESGERFANENCNAVVNQISVNAHHSQKLTYVILDQSIVESINTTVENFKDTFEAALTDNPGNNFFKADTIEELAATVDIEPAKLADTIDRYNAFCKQGLDEDYNKPAEMLIAIETAPYYIVRNDFCFWTSIGGINSNRKMEAINENGEAIPGLYAVGTDGCELYRETYTINVPGSCNGNNVNSGRTAARNAVSYLG